MKGLEGRMSPRLAWGLYDWADSAFVTTIVAAVLPVYFASVVCGGSAEVSFRLLFWDVSGSPTSLWGYAASIAALLVAVASPVAGALADAGGRRKVWLASSAALGIASSAMLSLSGPGMVLYTLAFLAVGEVGFSGAQVFYNSLLGDVSRSSGERDSVSSGGFALGYLGGGLLLALNTLMIARPGMFGLADAAAASRAGFATVAVWWAVFSIPLFLFVHEGGPAGRARGSLREAAGMLAGTARDIRSRRDLKLFLIAFLLYNDGIQTVILMASVYGKSDLGLDTSSLVGALLVTQIVGVPGSLGFGRAAGRIGARKALLGGIAAYLAIVLLASGMDDSADFMVLAILVGLFQGGMQAVSRSFFSRLVPPGRNAEYFGFFSVSTRFASIFGPLLFALVRDVTGEGRAAILAVAVLFLAGGAVLWSVRDPEVV